MVDDFDSSQSQMYTASEHLVRQKQSQMANGKYQLSSKMFAKNENQTAIDENIKMRERRKKRTHLATGTKGKINLKMDP